MKLVPSRFTAKFLSAWKVTVSPAPIACDSAPFSERSVIAVSKLAAFANHFALLIASATFCTVATLLASSFATVTLPRSALAIVDVVPSAFAIVIVALLSAAVILPVFTLTPSLPTVNVSVLADFTSKVTSKPPVLAFALTFAFVPEPFT